MVFLRQEPRSCATRFSIEGGRGSRRDLGWTSQAPYQRDAGRFRAASSCRACSTVFRSLVSSGRLILFILSVFFVGCASREERRSRLSLFFINDFVFSMFWLAGSPSSFINL